MNIETRWYYEELQPEGKGNTSFPTPARWVSAFYGYDLTRDQATELMEKRKAEVPRAKLRLVCQITKTRTYRERNSP